ncbi:MAG TPA: DUF2520 domain-containing protein [Polyangiaceae bacterium]|nr:DUF2520 domain-containing protein [Polyangiaceae bacterium]
MGAARPRAVGPVAIVGTGKVGRTLGRALVASQVDVRSISARRGDLRKVGGARVVVVATRDADVARTALALAPQLEPGAVVLHVAGALGVEILAPLRAHRVAVGSAHPLLAFADPKRPPPLEGGALVLDGDGPAVRAGRALARATGMVPLHLPGLDRPTYHAAAALFANGTIALAAASAELLEAAGVAPSRAPALLAPLLASVAKNLHHLGVVRALTGPVRRGDAAAVRAHGAALRAHAPHLVPLYRALVAAQVPMAAELGEADLREIERVLDQF